MEIEPAVAALVRDFRWGERTARLGFAAGFRCEYCHKDLLDSIDSLWWGLDVDHLVPLSAGGPDSSENLVFSCTLCNRLKGRWDPRTESAEIGRETLLRVARQHIQLLRAAKEQELLRTREVVAGVLDASR